jgi:hypothetical protein
MAVHNSVKTGKESISHLMRAEFLTGVYLDDAFPIGSRLQAVQLLGKMYGDYLDRVVLQKEEVQMPVINVTL